MPEMKPYAGIGSRRTPKSVLLVFQELSLLLEEKGYTLRSGGAPGADTAFEQNVSRSEIFLPWKNFNGNRSNLHTPPEEAFEIASKFHPAWNNFKRPLRLLMARNVQQILGPTLDVPSHFVVCWTPDGASCHAERTRATGGTGQAISIADYYNIPIYNFKDPAALERLLLYLDLVE